MWQKKTAVLFSAWLCLLRVSQSINITILTFIDYESSLEKYYRDAYRMAFTEVLSNKSFADFDSHEAEDFLYTYSERGTGGVLHQATIGSGENQANLTLRMVDVTGIASDEAAMNKAMSGAYQEEVDKGNFVVVVGAYSSSRERIKGDWAGENQVPFISGGGASSSIYEENRYAFGLLSPVSKLAESSMEFLLFQLEKKLLHAPVRIAVLWEDVPHGVAYQQGVVDFANAHPDQFQVVYNEPFPYNVFTVPSNFTSIMDDLRNKVGYGDKKDGANVLLVDAHSSDFQLMHRELIQHDVSFRAISYGARGTDVADLNSISNAARSDFPFVDDDPSNSKSSRENIVLGSLEGVFAGLWWSPANDSPGNAKFVQGWRKLQGLLWVEELDEAEAAQDDSFLFRKPDEQLPPAWFGATGYEAMRVMINAIRNTVDSNTTVTVEAVLESLGSTNIDSILPGGKIVFDSTGQVNGPFTIAQNLKDAKSEELNENHLELNPYDVFTKGQESVKDSIDYQNFTSPRPLCNAKDWDAKISECNSNNEVIIKFFWLDEYSNPCPGETPCYCKGNNTTLPGSISTACDFVNEDSSEAVASRAMVWTGVSIAAVCILVLLVSWRRPGLKGAHKPFLVLIAISTIFCCVSILTLIGPITETSCKQRIWAIGLSVGLNLSLLLGRVVYWYRVWSNPSTETLYCSAKELAKPTLLAFIACVVCIVVWITTQETFSFLAQESVGGVEFQVSKCDMTGSPAGAIMTGIFFFITLFLCILFAYQAKDCDGKFFASWYLWIATFNYVFVAILIAVLILLVQLDKVKSIMFIAICVFLSTVGFTIFSFIPRLSFEYGFALFGKNPNAQGTTTGAQSTDSENVVRKYIHGRAKRPTSQATDYN